MCLPHLLLHWKLSQPFMQGTMTNGMFDNILTISCSGAPFLAQVKETIEARYGNSFLFRRGLDKKKAYFEEGRLVTDSKYDMLVFRDIKQKTFGSNIRLVIMDNGRQNYMMHTVNTG